MKLRGASIVCLVACVSQIAAAQSFFLPAGDARLRNDLSLLVDESVINLPVNEWPLARADVAEALAGVDASDIHDAALRMALSRVVRSTEVAEDVAKWRIRQVGVIAGRPGLLRDSATLGRENGEVVTTGGASTDRYSINLSATGVVDAADGQDVRFDGSDISVRWGNWIFSANQMDRWWGPGHEGSLILSNNARPMPAVSLDRVRSLPVNLPVLRWLGPWRFSAFLGVGENERADVDRPAFMGMRLSFKPTPIFEFGMSRTAQFCGRGRRCDLKTFGRMLIGDDNRGMRGLPDDPEAEPGNQMAGFDVRIVSPFRALPVAVYGQEIGEDNSSTGIPERYLALFGGETWFMLDSGAVLRAHIEYANTKVKWYDAVIEPDQSYRQGIFFAGYRYRGRNIGHTTDADSETNSIAFSLTTPDGQRWGGLLRRGRLDRLGNPDIYNTVTFGPSNYRSLELSWEGRIGGHDIGVQLGHEKQSPASAGDAKGAFGFIRWRRSL